MHAGARCCCCCRWHGDRGGRGGQPVDGRRPYSRSCHHPSYRGPLPTALFPLRLSPGSLPSGLAPGDSHAWNWIRTDALPAAQGGAPPSLDLASFLPQERGRLVSFSGRLHGRHLCRLTPAGADDPSMCCALPCAMHARTAAHAHACLLPGFASFYFTRKAENCLDDRPLCKVESGRVEYCPHQYHFSIFDRSVFIFVEKFGNMIRSIPLVF